MMTMWGKALAYYLFNFFIIPGIVGFTVGISYGFYYARKKNNKSSQIAAGLFSGAVMAIIFPIAFQTFAHIHDDVALQHYQNRKQNYINDTSREFKISGAFAAKGKYGVKYVVPRSDSYRVYVIGYQDGRVIAHLPPRMINLNKGENEIVAPLVSSDINITSPIDFEVSVYTNDNPHAFIDTTKLIFYDPRNGMTNISNGVKYYSPDIAMWGGKPCGSNSSILCRSSKLLHITP